MADEFNLFQILDLDPNAPWDKALFEQRLEKKRNEWNKQVNHPSRGTIAKRNIGLIPSLKHVAADASRRKDHAKAALSASMEDRERLLKRREQDLRLLEAKGYLLESELADLATNYAVLGAESDLRAMVLVEIRKQAQRSQTAAEGLDPSIARGIREKLEQLGMRDLYQFLSETHPNKKRLDRGASIMELLDAAGRIYEQAATGKADYKNALRSALVGECKTHLKDQASKARYDATLDNARFEELLEWADLAAAATKELSADQVALLLRRFRADGGDGISSDSALAVLRAHAKKKGYSMEEAREQPRAGEPINRHPPSFAAVLGAVLVVGAAAYVVKLAYFPKPLQHVTFVTSETRATDTQGVLTITVARSSDFDRREAVEYASSDGTARGGEDYQSTHGTLNFAPGEKQQHLLVSLLPDTSFQKPDRYFIITLKNVVNNPKHVVLIAQKHVDTTLQQHAEELVHAASNVAMDIGTDTARARIFSRLMDSLGNDPSYQQYKDKLETIQGNLIRARERYVQQLRDMQAIQPNILMAQIDRVIAQQARDGFTQQSVMTAIMKRQVQEFLQSRALSMDRWADELSKAIPRPTNREPNGAI